MNETYDLKCITFNGEQRDVVIRTYENDESIEIIFCFDDMEISICAENFFEGLLELRKELEKKNIKLLCKGCSINVYPSAMILQMGAGRMAYCLTMGQPARMSSLINIFDACELNEYASIDEQLKYFNQWCDSL